MDTTKQHARFMPLDALKRCQSCAQRRMRIRQWLRETLKPQVPAQEPRK